MSAERAKEITNRRGGGEKNYSDGSAQDLDDAADPETFEDDQQESAWSRLMQHKAMAIGLSSLVVIALVLLFFFARDFIPGLLANPLVRAFAVLGAIVGTVFVWATKRLLGKLKEWDWLVEMLPHGVRVWTGEFDHGDCSFTPYRGFTLWGSRANEYEIADLGDQYTHHAARRGKAPDDPASIKLLRSFSSWAHTWMGTIAVTQTDGHAPNYDPSNHPVIATPPNEKREAEVSDLANQVQTLEDKLREKEERIDSLIEEKNTYKIEATARRDEIRTEVMQTLKAGGEAFRGHNPGGSGDESGSNRSVTELIDMEDDS